MNEEGQNDSPPSSVYDSDGKITLTFFNDNLEVRGDFFPPQQDGIPITGEYITELLEKANIVYGIQHDEIFKAYETCVNYSEIVRDVLIAKGDPPVNEVPEHMELNPLLASNKTEEATEKSTVDHRRRSPFIIVRKDQALAKLKRMQVGKEGTNVLGEPISFQVLKPATVIQGVNTRMEGNFLLSEINGQLAVIKGVVNVKTTLTIKGAVGYRTGNIIFPGDVLIDGPVMDGFKIISGGSVVIKQTFDVTEAITKGNLRVAGGIIGRGRGMLKVGGDIKTHFIENCRVACRKTVSVEAEVINSSVYTMETLVMGEKGRIVGGEVYAVKGVTTGYIGKKTGKAARIHCGIDFVADQERQKANGILKMLAVKAARIKELMDNSEADDEKKEKMKEILIKLEEEKEKAQAKISEILGRLNSYETAVVEVTGEIIPGTLIEICQVALFVTESLKNVRIRLGRESNKLITEKIT